MNIHLPLGHPDNLPLVMFLAVSGMLVWTAIIVFSIKEIVQWLCQIMK